VIASEFGTGQVFWSMVWFVVFFIWIWLLITVFADIFRSPDLGGFAKAMWVLFVIVVPYLGVFVYLIARGNKMHELARLDDMHKRGVIGDAEYQQLKADVVS
jgi:hypothetical protein